MTDHKGPIIPDVGKRVYAYQSAHHPFLKLEAMNDVQRLSGKIQSKK